MACNCATSKQIDELYKKYGEKRRQKLTFKQRVRNIFMYTGVVIAMIPIVPCLFLYVLYKRLCDDNHNISLTKFFRLDKKKIEYVGQQNI